MKEQVQKTNSAVRNMFKERILRVETLRVHQLLRYGKYGDECNNMYPTCPKKEFIKKKSKPCPPKPCKKNRYACDLPDPPHHCPYKPPKCKKICIPNVPKPKKHDQCD